MVGLPPAIIYLESLRDFPPLRGMTGVRRGIRAGGRLPPLQGVRVRRMEVGGRVKTLPYGG